MHERIALTSVAKAAARTFPDAGRIEPSSFVARRIDPRAWRTR